MGGRERYSFNCWKARTHSSVHSNPLHLFNNWTKGLHLSTDQEMNQFRVAVILVSFFTFLGFQGGCRLLISLIWSGLTSISQCITMYPRNFTDLTPKEHLEALSHNLRLLKISKIFPRSLTCSDSNLLLTTMLSIYTSIFLPSCGSNILVIIL